MSKKKSGGGNKNMANRGGDGGLEALQGWTSLAGRLDMAAEASALLRGAADVELAGVSEEKEEREGVVIHTVTVLNSQGARLINKPEGRYLTFQLPEISSRRDLAAVAQVVGAHLQEMLPPLEGRTLLVAGLGNRFATPDALGPRVAERTFATRHLFREEEIEGLNRVCAISAGVMGTSGLESAELIRGLCQHVRPAAVIAIDSLAAASVNRVGSSIQMSDTGIHPGSGVGNNRPGVDAAICGCPVIAIGVPTVVDAAAIICETVESVRSFWNGRGVAMPLLDEESCAYTEQRLLEVFGGRLVVTPKDIDELIDSDAEIIAAAIAMAVHPAADKDNYRDFIR